MAAKLLSSIFLLAWCFRSQNSNWWNDHARMPMIHYLLSTLASSKMIIPSKVILILFLYLFMFITEFPYTTTSSVFKYILSNLLVLNQIYLRTKVVFLLRYIYIFSLIYKTNTVYIYTFILNHVCLKCSWFWK